MVNRRHGACSNFGAVDDTYGFGWPVILLAAAVVVLVGLVAVRVARGELARVRPGTEVVDSLSVVPSLSERRQA